MSQFTLRKSPVGTHHVFAECRDCPWKDDDYTKAERTARRHAKTTGHMVMVERGQTWTYNERNERAPR